MNGFCPQQSSLRKLDQVNFAIGFNQGVSSQLFENVAVVIVQLDIFTENKSGSLVMDDDRNVTVIGPAKIFDVSGFFKSSNGDCDVMGFFFKYRAVPWFWIVCPLRIGTIHSTQCL